MLLNVFDQVFDDSLAICSIKKFHDGSIIHFSLSELVITYPDKTPTEVLNEINVQIGVLHKIHQQTPLRTN